MGAPRTSPRMGTDAVTADPKHYKVEFENAHVRVLRARYGPHEKSVMHSHPPVVAVFLNGLRGQFTYPDGRVEPVTAKAGEFQYSESHQHLPENLGDEPFEVLLIEFKS